MRAQRFGWAWWTTTFAVLMVLAGGAAGQAPATPKLSADQLDKLTAPIALYPDALVIQIAQCAASPYQVRQVDDWLKKNPTLKGSAAQDAAAKQGFDASFVALVLFPQVIEMMAGEPDWTREFGQAFTTDRDGVFASIQRLRAEAKAMGNLKTTEQQTVQTVKTDSGDTVIMIQPANPQVVYVPQYNPQVVYTQPAPAPSSSSAGDDTAQKVAIGVISFAAGVIVGAAADNDHDHYYYSYGGWGYAHPICYPGGYNNYYQHRENMANDYYQHRQDMANDWYDHRENMADQAGKNQAQRQDYRSDTRSSYQDTRSQNQTARQDTRTTNQSARQDAWQSDGSSRQNLSRDNAGSWQSDFNNNRAGSTARGGFGGDSGQSRGGLDSGAFSGYQRGSTERASSDRGRQSLGGGGFGEGGGGRLEGGGFGGGGRGRGRR